MIALDMGHVENDEANVLGVHPNHLGVVRSFYDFVKGQTINESVGCKNDDYYCIRGKKVMIEIIISENDNGGRPLNVKV